MKKNAESIIKKCMDNIKGFQEVHDRFEEAILISGRSNYTFANYIRAIAHVSWYYQQNPLTLTDVQLNRYLLMIYNGQLERKLPSESYFKFIIYSFRNLFKIFNLEGRQVNYTVIKRNKPLPIILNRVEVYRLIKMTANIKHRLILGIAYGAGLRMSEIKRLRIGDIDTEQCRIYVKPGKSKYGRYVYIGEDFIIGYLKYSQGMSIDDLLFSGLSPKKQISSGAIRHFMTRALIRSAIQKKVSIHTLRHSYATHFIEDTGDLLALKKNLGHESIEHTLHYVRVANSIPTKSVHTPLSNVIKIARQKELSSY